MIRLIIALIGQFATLVSRLLDVHVDGVEITQAIQYYHARRHLSDPSQQGLDNSVRLVIGKPAFVRVYLRSGLRSFGADTATLEVRRRTIHGVYAKVATLTALPPGEMFAQSNPPYAKERGDYMQLPYYALIGSLNFVVPASMMFGSMLFRVNLTEGRSFGGIFSTGVRDTYDVYADVRLRQTLRLRSIMVGYAGPKSSSDPAPLFLSPPSFPFDLQNTATWTLLMYPVQNQADCSSAGFVTCDRPLDNAGCSPNWDALIAKLTAQKAADGNRSDVIYYGLLPADLPFRAGRDKIGCERSGMSVGRVDGPNSKHVQTEGGHVMAHLVGHECGLLHAPGLHGFGQVDPNYPAYPPYDPIGTPKGSLGEYGTQLFTAGAGLYLPQNNKDIMGTVSDGSWMSLYHYGRLIENPRLDPVITEDEIFKRVGRSVKYAQDVDPQPMISIIGLMRSEKEFEATSVMRLETRPLPFSARASGLTAELRDEDGKPVAHAPLRLLRSWADGDGCGCNEQGASVSRFPCVVQALVPDAGRGALLAISDGERDLWSCAGHGTKPHVASFSASLNENRLAVTWNVKAAGQAAEVWLQWSADRGETWNALATGLAGDAGEFDTSHLPAGTVTLRLLASDGFDTEISGHASVHLPQRPPAVSILTPADGETLFAGGTLRLWGAVNVDGHAAVAVEKARWLLDGEPVAEGLDAFCRVPPAGEHILKLIVTADSLEGTGSLRFVSVELAEGRERARYG